MKLSAYLSPSRHGVYYFRWPLPRAEDHKRRTVRIPLRTKCPDRASDLARHLASCGRLMRENKTLGRLRQDQMREMVRSYFTASLDWYVERLNDTGLPDRSLDALRQELDVREDAKAALTTCQTSTLTQAAWTASGPQRASQRLSRPRTSHPCAKRCARPAGTKSKPF